MFDHERNKDLELDDHSQNTHQYPLSYMLGRSSEKLGRV